MFVLCLGQRAINRHHHRRPMDHQQTPSQPPNNSQWTGFRRTPSLPNLSRSNVVHTPVEPRNGRRHAAFTSGLHHFDQTTTPGRSPLSISVHTQPSTPVHLSPSTPCPRSCAVCGSTDLRPVPVDPKGSKDTICTPSDAYDGVFNILHRQNWSLGGFLRKVFSRKTPDGSDYGNQANRLSVTRFLRNQCKEGERPADILSLIYNNTKGMDYAEEGGARLETNYQSLPPYAATTEDVSNPASAPAWPPILPSRPGDEPATPRCHASIDQWCLDVVLGNVDREAAELARSKFDYKLEGRGSSWSSLLDFDFNRVRHQVMRTAPNIWSILMTICTSPWRRKKIAEAQATAADLASAHSAASDDLGDDMSDVEEPPDGDDVTEEAEGANTNPPSHSHKEKQRKASRAPWMVIACVLFAHVIGYSLLLSTGCDNCRSHVDQCPKPVRKCLPKSRRPPPLQLQCKSRSLLRFKSARHQRFLSHNRHASPYPRHLPFRHPRRPWPSRLQARRILSHYLRQH